MSRETRKERVEKATGQGAGLSRHLPKLATANVVRQGIIAKPRSTAAYRGKTGLNPSREISKC